MDTSTISCLLASILTSGLNYFTNWQGLEMKINFLLIFCFVKPHVSLCELYFNWILLIHWSEIWHITIIPQYINLTIHQPLYIGCIVYSFERIMTFLIIFLLLLFCASRSSFRYLAYIIQFTYIFNLQWNHTKHRSGWNSRTSTSWTKHMKKMSCIKIVALRVGTMFNYLANYLL